MLDGLLGRGFAGKCKSLMKMVKARIDVIRRKRNATQKFLKKDMADLLASGLDDHAYGRADGLLVELDLSSCYDFVEKSCEFVAKHLSIMQKQSECPEECREAVSSLMFAAARFSDLPELRELRQIFREKYRNSLDYFANKEFVEKLASKPPTIERRIKLMRDIASEYAISWNANAFEFRMSKPVPQHQPKTYGSLYSTDDRSRSQNGKDNVPKGHKSSVSAKEREGLTRNKHEFCNGMEGNYSKGNEPAFQPREVACVDGYRSRNRYRETSLTADGNGISLQRKQEVTVAKEEQCNRDEATVQKRVQLGGSSQGKRQECDNGGYKLYYERENSIPGNDMDSTLPNGEQKAPHCSKAKSPSDGKNIASYGHNNLGQNNSVNSIGKVQVEERDKLNSFCNSALPPPYFKPHTKAKEHKYGADLASLPTGYDSNGLSKDTYTGDKSGNSKSAAEAGLEHPNHEGQVVRYLTVSPHEGEKNHHHEVEVSEEPLTRPRSQRRRHSKSRSRHDDMDNNEDIGFTRTSSRSKRRDRSREGLQQALFDNEHYQKDEEERIIDRLLIHYSKKPSAHERGMVKRKSRTHRAQLGADASDLHHNKKKDGSDEQLEAVSLPVRSVSLPNEHKGPSETKKTFGRTASFQPDRPAQHVHPKLPDYDDLAARFAALKGR